MKIHLRGWGMLEERLCRRCRHPAMSCAGALAGVPGRDGGRCRLLGFGRSYAEDVTTIGVKIVGNIT